MKVLHKQISKTATGGGQLDKIIIGSLLATTFLIGGILASTRVKASNNVVDEVFVTVPTLCSLSGNISTGNEHTATVLPGSYTQNIGKTNLKALCNDFDGFSIYAIGYTNNTEGTNTMVGMNTNQTIATGTATNGNTSNWAMKLTKVTNPASGDAITYNPDNLTITTGYSDYHAVPDVYTKVATYKAASGSSATDSTLGSNIETTYAAFMSSSQAADTYVGKVKYLLVHPANIDSISSTAITAVFQAYPGGSISFADGSTTNTVVFRQICEDPNDSTTCTFMVTDGEYKEPLSYKGAWLVPLPDGQNGYTISAFEIQDGANEWADGLNAMGGAAFLGQTVPIYAYNGNAVIYDGNGATAGDMSHVASRFGDPLRDSLASNEAQLIAPNFYKTGYGFAGWSTSSSATVGSDTIYGPNATITTSDVSFDSDGTDTLYAVWVASTGNMQSFSCSSLNSGSITALTDTRDGNVYTVGKLADGNCWMMENLRLDGQAALNSSNTNQPVISSLGASKDSWCSNSTSACIDQSVINTNNTNMGGVNSLGDVLVTYYSNGTDSYRNKEQWYGYGNYYDWYAATAGNGTYSVDGYGENVAGDICPAGWSLPTGGTGGQFSALSVALGGLSSYMNSETSPTGATVSKYFRNYPNNFVYSGSWGEASADNRSYYGYYWSRTADYSDNAHGLYLDSDYVNPGTSAWSKYYGLTVRCLQSGS